jgi:hypothetical protein
MRRLVFSVIVASGLVVIGAGPAFAEAAPTAAGAKAVPGKKMCKIVDPKLNEISGLVATKTGYVVINDSTDVPSHKRVFFLNEDCKITKSVPFSGNGPRDTEDMVLSADGRTLWISDAGDNDYADANNRRPNIVLWTMPVSGASEPKLHRLAYPSGEHHDSEALLLTGDNTPIVVTKEVGRPAVLFEPTTALKTNNETSVPLRKVGEFQPPDTDTASNPLAHVGRKTVTGAAIALGGTKVALRTYTDAYEWDVTGGDVLAALKGAPRKTALENEPLGEAITYSADGKYFYTVSDMQGVTATDGANANYLLRYTPAAKVVAAGTAGTANGDKAATAAWYKNLSLDDITYMVGGVGLLGAILVGFGVVGIVRARKKAPLEPASKVVDGGPAGPLPSDAETELLAVGGLPGRPGAVQGQRPGVYGAGNRPGGAPQPGGAQQPGVYGAASAPSVPPHGGVPQRNGVYGGPGGGQQGGGRPVPPGGRPPQGGQPGARPPQGGQPGVRPPQGGQPGVRPPQGGQPAGRPPQGGQPGARPPQGVPPAGRPGRNGAYGPPPPAAPPAPPPASGRGGGPGQRPSGFAGADQPDRRRQVDAGLNGYAEANGPSRRPPYDRPGYGR